MFFSTKPPSDAVNAIAPLPQSKVPRKIGLYTPTVAEIISWAMSGQLVGYSKNRGTGIVDTALVRSIMAELRIESMDGFKASERDGQIVLADAHDRLQALLMSWWSGAITKAQLESTISFRIVDESIFHKVYVDSHARQKAASKKQQLRNTDFVYGDIIFNKLLPGVTNKAAQVFYDRFGKCLDQLGTILYIFHDKSLDRSDYSKWNYTNVYPFRAALKTTLYLPAGKFRMDSADMDDLRVVLGDFYELHTMLASNASTAKVMGQSAWFGFYAAERLCPGSPLAEWPNNRIAKKLHENIVNLVPCINLLCNSSKAVMLESCEQLYRSLRRNHQRVKI